MPGTTVGLWQGPWLTATAYVVGDQVTYGGNSYICIVAHTSGSITPADTSKWSLTTAQGGTGATGPVDPLGYAHDATTAAIGALLLERATALAHPKALITDSLNQTNGPAGLDANGYLQVIKGTPYDILGTPALTADGTDVQMVCPRAFSITAGHAAVTVNPPQTVTITLLRNGVSVGTISIATNGTVSTTGFGSPVAFTADQALSTSVSGSTGVSGLLYSFAGRAD